jgi:hypothetical protein
MDTIEQAVAVLADAEKKLRELVGSAAAAGEYDRAMRVAQWAKSLAALNQNGASAESASTSHAVLGSTSDAVGEGAPSPGRSLPTSRTRARGRATEGHQGRRSPAKGEYPRFFRRADQLVKIGWSKKERAEYEHRAPRRAIELLADAIGRKWGNGKLFSSEEVLPLRDPTDGSDVPGYQGYVALAWFKAAGLIKQNGRRGYSAKKGAKIVDEAAAMWAGLPEQEA